VEDGRIDILARAKTGRFVVFELKASRRRNKTLGQILYYMGLADTHLSKEPCRGIIIAKDISDDLILATQRVPGVSLYRYELSVSVEQVT
jgi:RecB family endonuclease NucS